ncbi:hypothetical protein RHMOL_Rhmol03G0004200 [Rhododendron molle]|uniref:Uncharacterized protein n=1 Tax=Rhododendron molle TaxID=49168 RepID=A0ACC0PA61_RHOML|nr:hypothetical protein RHMOL_Rhmol03G0004200 [Rhododendron molle]
MRSQGPSPWVPLLMVGVLSLIVFGDMISSIAEFVLPLLLLRGGGEEEDEDDEGGDEDGGATIKIFLPLILLLLVHFLAVFSPTLNIFSAFNRRSECSDYDSDGFGLGALLLLVLFFVLYNVWG